MGSLADRLRKNLKHLNKWAKREGVTCFRAYDHDIPEFPLTVEIYEGQAVAYVSFRSDDEWPLIRAEFIQQLTEEMTPQLGEIIFKDRGVRPGGTRAPGAVSDRLDLTQTRTVSEGGLDFEVNLRSHNDSGLFLDHRKTRQMVRDMSRDKQVLNLFCYTGSFSVYAAAGGARSVTSIDLSKTYLDWTARNFLLNDMEPDDYKLVQGDILQWLPVAEKDGKRYDIIICDPPTFSNSKRMVETLDTKRAHADLLRSCVALLRPGGQLIFSTNASNFKLDPALVGFVEISDKTRCEDYRRGGGHRCWVYRDA
ncbi:unnamed protein product [Phaeothamnion confervicola]